ncbi:MAG: type II toxin-antitoxin system CcdA family antitoxin [Pseudonocardia sp.]|jgi:post-segregation antitoxin (ccd killing protein)
MARVNIYLPDELAESARAAGLNISALAQAAITAELSQNATDAWLAELPTQRRVSHDQAMAALDAARTEREGLDDPPG